MTYHTLKCPHCNRVVAKGTGSPSYIGNPIHKCPFCGGIYTDPFTMEWINKSPISRFFFYTTIPLCAGFISFIAIAGLLCLAGVNTLIALISSVCFSVIISMLVFFIRRSIIKQDIQKSFERTKYANYVEQLKNAGYKFYYINGVEVGTIKDEDADNKTDEQDINEAKDTMITLH